MDKLLKFSSIFLCGIIFSLTMMLPTWATSTPLIYAEECICQSGDIVEIPLKIQSNTGIMGIGLEITYSSECLTPISVTNGSIISEGMTTDSIGSSMPGNFQIFWAGTENMVENGTIFTILFSTSSNIPRDETIGITILQDDTFDENYSDVVVSKQDVLLTIESGASQESEHISLSVQPVEGNEKINVTGTATRKELAINSEVEIFFDSTVLSFLNVTGNDIDISGILNRGNSIVFQIQSIATVNTDLFSLQFSRLTDQDAQLIFRGNATAIGNTVPLQIMPTAYTLSETGIKIYTREHVYGKYGSDIDIPIFIANNPGIMGYKLFFQYDPDLIEPFSIISANLFSGMLENSLNEINSGEFSVVWCDTENQTQNGKLFTIRCHVLSEEIDSTPFVISYSTIDTFNESFEPVIVTCLSSTIELNKSIVGDLNDDMYVDSQDLVLLKRSLLGIDPLLDSMDIDENDVIDIRDLIRLKKIIATLGLN